MAAIYTAYRHDFAADLVKSKVDVIYAVGDAAIRAAQQATTTIPILGSTDDMVEVGLVKSSSSSNKPH
jgi:ABC-type uncharacterized transport system substrate-binding protein